MLDCCVVVFVTFVFFAKISYFFFSSFCSELAVPNCFTILRSFLFPPFQNNKSIFIFYPGKIHVLWLPPMKCRVFFHDLGGFSVTWVNILSNMLILIVVMETSRTNHKNFQVVLHWHIYMPQQFDDHLRMIIMLQWHIAVSCDHVIAWDHIITISIQSIINIKYLIIIIFCNAINEGALLKSRLSSYSLKNDLL